MSATKNIVTVFGATGSQGGSVAKYLLNDGTFAVRAVTRNVGGVAAQVLKSRGAEIVAGDLNKPETLFATVSGAYAVFGVTDFWSLFPTIGDMEKTQEAEVSQGKALIDAAKAAGVQHFIWSTLWHSNVPHFEGKAEIDDYLKASGISRTSVYSAAYMENMVTPISGLQLCTPQADGSLAVDIKMPNGSSVPMYSVDQTGGWVLQALKNPSVWIGKDMHMIGEHIALDKIGHILAKVTGRKTVVNTLSLEDFKAMERQEGFAKEMFLNLNFFFEHCQLGNSVYDMDLARRGYADAHDFEAFAKNNERFAKFAASL